MGPCRDSVGSARVGAVCARSSSWVIGVRRAMIAWVRNRL